MPDENGTPTDAPKGDANKPENKGKTFTQEQLDHLFAERTKNVKDKVMSEILADLGVADVDTAKAILLKQKEAEEAQKSELQKAQDAMQAAQTDAQKVKAEAEQIKAQAREMLVKAETIRTATAFKDTNGNTFRPEAVDDVWLLIDKKTITDEEDGTFKGIKEAVEKVAKDRPHWLANGKAEQRTPNGTPRFQKQNTEKDKETPTPRPVFKL